MTSIIDDLRQPSLLHVTPTGVTTMSKGQKSNKENKKAPLMTPEEKKIAKRNKKAGKDGISLFDNKI